ncbi:MAG: carotenoid oxygenase family protein [Rhodanobacter sp.]
MSRSSCKGVLPMKSYPDLPAYTGFNTPSRMEVDIDDLEVEGQVPTELDGIFFRVGPDPQYPPLLGSDIYFNGDGMISAFRFENGRVDLKCRYARTDKFLLERAAKHALFGAYRNPFFDDPQVAGKIRGTANTNVLVHGGKLLALKEDSPPLAMDPWTLETQGYWDFDGKLASETFTAHPKIDPRNGEMICFGYSAKGIATPDLAYYVVDAQGRIVHETWIEMPYPCMVHDFGVTQDYVVFPIVPVVSSLERAKEGKPTFGWDSSKDVWLGVLPRRGTARDLRWFRAPNRFASHVMNAFNDGSKIYVDMPVAKGNMFPFFPDITGAPFDPVAAVANLNRWSVDYNKLGGEIGFEQLTTLAGEFPRIDDRYASEPYRHGYLSVSDRSRPFDVQRAGSITGMFINCLGHIDHATKRQDVFYAGPVSSMQEPAFVPKSATSPEGEGYLVVLINRHDELRSDLLVLDAQNLEAGPLATIKLPLKLRNGLHGNWASIDQLPPRPVAVASA